MMWQPYTHSLRLFLQYLVYTHIYSYTLCYFAKTSAILLLNYESLTCLGHLGRCNTKRIISISVTSPKATKAATGNISTTHYHKCFCHKYNFMELCLQMPIIAFSSTVHIDKIWIIVIGQCDNWQFEI